MSIEDQLSSIEEQYQIAYNLLTNMAYVSTDFRTDKYVSAAIKSILSFQRNIELLAEDVRKLSDEKTKFYVDRLATNIVKIRVYLRDGDSVCSRLDAASFEQAFLYFRNIRATMYQILEDVRLIYALRIYPIEEKMALKSRLSDYGFVDVVKCLDEAEDNLATRKPEHMKDCVDRSREALEKTAASILVAENKKPSGYFATDMGTLSGLGLIDKESKKLAEATHSYLSEVGAHGRSGEVTLGDAHYAMKETYMRIDILLKKFAEHSAEKQQSRK